MEPPHSALDSDRFNTGGQAVNADLTGASDCCQTFTNNFLYDGGIVASRHGMHDDIRMAEVHHHPQHDA